MQKRDSIGQSEETLSRLQAIMDSVPGSSQEPENVMRAWQIGADEREARRAAPMTDEQKRHEAHVNQAWEDAVRQYVRPLRVNRRWRRPPWAPAAEFIAAHFDDSPVRALNRVCPCVTDSNRSVSAGRALGVGLLLTAWIWTKTAWYEAFSDTVHLLTLSAVLFIALLMEAKPLRCRIIRRRAGSEREEIEAYCDVYAGSAWKAAPRPLLILSALSFVVPPVLAFCGVLR